MSVHVLEIVLYVIWKFLKNYNENQTLLNQNVMIAELEFYFIIIERGIFFSDQKGLKLS